MRVTIRKATEEDYRIVTTLSRYNADYHHNLDAYWKSGREAEKTFIEHITMVRLRYEHLLLVAEVDGTLGGYFLAKIKPAHQYVTENKIGYISNAFVLEKYRGRGVLKKAYRTMLDWFKEKGVRTVELSVSTKNKHAIAVWEQYAFKDYMCTMRATIADGET